MAGRDAESEAGLRFGLAPGHKRLRLTVAYCGTPWAGWQSQAGGSGIQDQLAAAILKATGITTVVYGSGRTDAGVHALAQVAHLDVPETVGMSTEAWIHAINACLPPTIRVMDCAAVESNFHARFDATGKVYRYRIWRPRLLSPFEGDRAWHVYGPLDMVALRACARKLVGTHNFVRLSANRGDMPEVVRRTLPDKTTRTLFHADVREAGDLLELEFTGDGFLYKMVRLIVGALVHVARGRATEAWFADLLATAEGPQNNQCAPAAGLYLMRVLYDDVPPQIEPKLRDVD